MKKNLLNIILFQLGWFVCIWGGNAYAIAYTTAALLIHHFFVIQHERVREWAFINVVTVTGALWDAVVVFGSWINYTKTDILGIPVWLVCLWMLFATTLRHSLVWLQRNTILTALLGLIFGPLSYWAGTQWGGAHMSEPTTTALLVIGLGWFFLLPCYAKIAQRLNAS